MNFSELLSKYSSPENRSLENWNPNRVRHNVYSPEGKEALMLFDKAVGLMKERSSKNQADLLGWNYQAGIHGIWNLDYKNPEDGDGWSREKLADFAEKNGFDSKENVLTGNTVLDNCTHFTRMWNGANLDPGTTAKVNNRDSSPANFIAWHRLYLQYFEEIVRENLRLNAKNAEDLANAETWALPYWAYLNEEDILMPEMFRNTGSNLYTPYRNPQLNAGTALTQLTDIKIGGNAFPADFTHNWPAQTLQGLNKNNYMAMGTLIEYMPHNRFHVASGAGGSLFGDQGLMLPTSSAAFDPIFWVHHSFIDKLWSAYNASENANYAFKYDFDQNPWNYMFLKPSPGGNIENAKDRISYWGDNSNNVISKIYNPDYSYDYLGTTTNPASIPGPNKVLSIIQAPAYRPTISEIKWSESSKPIASSTLYSSIIPLTINSLALTVRDYLNLTNAQNHNSNPFDLVSEVELLLPNPPAKATFLLTTASLANDPLDQGMADLDSKSWGLSVQGMSMGVDECHQKNPTSHSHCDHMPMLMPTTAIIDFGYSVIQPNGKEGNYGYSNIPADSNSDEQIVLLMVTNSADALVSSVTTSLNQNLNKNSSNDSIFDATAYFTRFPKLLTNPEATANPEAYFEKYDKGKGIVAPELNFRAAATGMAYLFNNKKLLEVGISSSPYAAMSHYH
ncbi:tyrosinase family protein [Synechococcus sp. UW140]|uniref:tyrosinase family protein n=1 Tax=Synechococcus sp. UW140 TaxID=368503 RepID=UPI003137AF1C